MGSSNQVGGNINFIASTSAWKQRSYHYNYNYNYYDNEAPSKEINLRFDEVSDDSTTQRHISLQLKKSKNSTRLISTVPIQVTTIQYSSNERIKKNITCVNTGELLDHMRQIQLQEYGYTNEWRLLRGLEANDVRVRGVIAQELNKKFPEHIEILVELAMNGQGTT